MEMYPDLQRLADDESARQRRRLNAQLQLALIRKYDSLIERNQQLAERSDLPAYLITFWQKVARIQFEKATGVEMSQKDELRAKLLDAASSGNATVDEIIKAVRAAHTNGSPLASPESFAGGGGI